MLNGLGADIATIGSKYGKVEAGFFPIDFSGIKDIRFGALIVPSLVIAFLCAIESLLSPLRVLHVPVHEFAMMMTIALRFIPLLSEETGKISLVYDSKISRGYDREGLKRELVRLLSVNTVGPKHKNEKEKSVNE